MFIFTIFLLVFGYYCCRKVDLVEKVLKIFMAYGENILCHFHSHIFTKKRLPWQNTIKCIQHSREKSLAELLSLSQKKTENKIRLITTFNERNPPLKEIIRMHDSWLDKTKKDIQSQDVQMVYRKAKNLKQLLVKGKINILT